jgi:hypothetical protein
MLYFRMDIWITPKSKRGSRRRSLASCIFKLQFPQAVCTKTTIKQFTDVLNFVQVQLHRMALAFRPPIRLAFMIDHAAKIQQIRILSYKKGSRFFCSL